MLVIILTLLVAVLFYRYAIKPTYYWKERGVPYQSPWPIFGNMTKTFFRQKSIFQQSLDFYNEFPDKRYNGIFQFTKPMLLIRDLDLLKEIMVKDFDSFVDHNAAFLDADPLLAGHLFALKGQRWRDMRATVSPSFTSSKMRYMFGLMLECAERFSAHLEEAASQKEYISETRDLYLKFTNDVIASVVFGYTCDSIAEPENEFYLMGKKATNFSGAQFLRFILLQTFPVLSKRFKMTFMPKKVHTFFQNVVEDNIKKREENGIVRPDMMQLLLDVARSGRNKHKEAHDNTQDSHAAHQNGNLQESEQFLTHADIITHTFVFFIAGFDTVATLMSFASYELARNVDVQEKLQAEVDETIQKCNGKITYEALLGMKYLEMVISEVLRLWGPGFQTDRVCTENYELQPVLPNEKPLLIEKGTLLYIPINGIHMDPKIYPNPQKFDPERFSEKNKESLQAFAYMPFGAGPRLCVASRFALLEGKAMLCHVLSKFTITVVDKTPIPLVLSKKTFTLMPDGGIWLGYKLREKRV